MKFFIILSIVILAIFASSCQKTYPLDYWNDPMVISEIVEDSVRVWVPRGFTPTVGVNTTYQMVTRGVEKFRC
jgi:hypothetical protein